jgi:predicted HD superfamily hydrolase involved in NAD metabolism
MQINVVYKLLNIEDIKTLLKNRLSKKRFIHSLNVADECVKLAAVYKEDISKAYLAGLIHDICKEMPNDEMYELVIKSNLAVDKCELLSKSLWHAIAGAYYIKENLEINDFDVINAVRFHTVGRASMSRLEEIVYLGDLISVDRTYKDVTKLRKYAYCDIDKAIFMALCFSITDVIEGELFIPVSSIEAYNKYATLVKRKERERS